MPIKSRLKDLLLIPPLIGWVAEWLIVLICLWTETRNARRKR